MLLAAHNCNEDCEEQVQKGIMRRGDDVGGWREEFSLMFKRKNSSSILKTPSGLLSRAQKLITTVI